MPHQTARAAAALECGRASRPDLPALVGAGRQPGVGARHASVGLRTVPSDCEPSKARRQVRVPEQRPELHRLSPIERIPGLAALWARTLGHPQVTIALLDGPVDHSHPVLAGADLAEYDVLGRGASGGPLTREHGTHVASIIFGRHHGVIKGIAPHCRGLVIPIYQEDGTRASCSQQDLARAIEEAVRLGADVINISGGELSPDLSASEELRRAIRTCVHHDRLIVAAAGNDGCQECLHVPGALPSVLAVGAMDWHGQPLAGSNWGDTYRSQGILAPGADIPGAVPGGDVTVQTGSSFAAPVVAGIAGLLLSLQRQAGSIPDPFLVREALLRTANGCGGEVSAACDRLLAGRLNVGGATQFLTTGGQHMPSETRIRSSAEDPTNDEPVPIGALPEEDETLEDDADEVEASAASSGGSAHAPHRHTRRGVLPSCGCGCQAGRGDKVYVVGDLDIDFVSPARRDSIQANAFRLPLPGETIDRRTTFLRYLLGIEFKPDADVPGGKPVRDLVDAIQPKGNLYDAESVYWVLKQADCPIYAIKPQGAFAAAVYRQLAIFLIEQTFSNYQAFMDEGISERCLDDFYPCYGGTQQPFRESLSRPETLSLVEESEREPGELPSGGGRRRRGKGQGSEPPGEEGGTENAGVGTMTADTVVNRAFDLFNEPPVSAARVALAGTIMGKVQLFTGEEVEVIAPAMRGMQNWNTRRLIEQLIKALERSGTSPSGLEAQVTLLALRIVSRLYELVRNAGKDPCDRARNYFATTQLFNLASTVANPAFLSMLGAFGPPAEGDSRELAINVREFLNITADALQCRPAPCVRYGAEPYEVELSFYNFANQFMGSVAVAQTIDVSDDVPVPMDRTRAFPRRS